MIMAAPAPSMARAPISIMPPVDSAATKDDEV
jgi:hypothetical protein